jgi:hypothetical protein
MVRLKGYTLMLALVVIIVVSSIAAAFLAYFRINYYYLDSSELNIKASNYCYEGFSLLNSDEEKQYERTINFPDGIQLAIAVKKWGLYGLFYSTCKRLDRDTLFSKIALVGYRKKDSVNLALYLRRGNPPLNIGNHVSLYADCYLPSGTISGMSKQQQISGILHHSVDTIVRLNNVDSVISWLKSYSVENRGASVIEDTLAVSFEKITEIYSYDSVYINNYVNGNVIIRAGHVAIKENVELSNAIIIANTVSIPAHFHGSLQVFATEYIDVGSDATFDYPSVVALLPEANTSSPASIYSHYYINAADSFKLYGELYAYAFSYATSRNIFAALGKGSSIMGGIYSTGSVTWQGHCKGTIICERLLNYNGGGLQANFLENSVIDTIPTVFSYSGIYPYRGKKKIVAFVQ